jgi:hypothetical protein
MTTKNPTLDVEHVLLLIGQNPCVATEQKRKKLHHNKKVFLFSVMFIEPQE